AREAARPRVGHDVPGRHAHGRRARRAIAAQARRPGFDPHGARGRVQAPGSMSRRLDGGSQVAEVSAPPTPKRALTSLRSRLFLAVVLFVVVCVGRAVGVGLVLTRRAVDKATLADVSHQADLIATSQNVNSVILPFSK